MKDENEAWAMIADELGEKDFEAREQLREVVRELGEGRAFALLERVIAIEDAGGERVPDGGRRRTAGGIFFRMARKSLPRDAQQRIFYGKGKGGSGAKPATEKPTAEKGSGARPKTTGLKSVSALDKPVVQGSAPIVEKPRARRRIVEVEAPPSAHVAHGVSAASGESGEYAIASLVQSARDTIAVALEPLSVSQRRQLLEEFQAKGERATSPRSGSTRRRVGHK
jgi:hypothetical protein